jgi:hypothetical protein
MTDPVPDDAPKIVPDADFGAIALEAPIMGSAVASAWELASAFHAAAREAQEDSAERRVFGLIGALCDIHISPDDRANVWGPKATGVGWRLALPEDFKGEQSEILARQLPTIRHAALRARLADIVWTNDPRAAEVARTAVDAYCEGVEGLLRGRLQTDLAVEGKASLVASEAAHRALQIAQRVSPKLPGSKKAELPSRVVESWVALYRHAIDERAFVVFGRVAELGLYYQLIDRAEVARDAEAVARAGAGAYAMAVKSVWDLGVRLYRQVGDADGMRRCQLGALDQILAMRSEVSSAGAEASWVMDALQALQFIEGMEEKEAELQQDLRRLQRAALKEFGTFTIPLEIEEDRDRILAAFDAFDLPTALYEFARLAQSRPLEELKAEAREAVKRAPLMSMMGAVHVDDEGKFVGKTPGADDRNEPSESWYRKEIDRAEDFRRQRVVGAAIDPARVLMHHRFDLKERHFAPIVARSPFVPASQEPLLALGFTRFFQGDFMSATHLLIPQIEPCLRHILKVAGHDPAKRFADATEEDHNIGGLLTRFRSELEHILTAPIVAELEALFHSRPGPALRHEMAHGQLGAGSCFHPTLLYASWFLYRLCCLFVLRDWPTIIAPAIAAEG